MFEIYQVMMIYEVLMQIETIKLDGKVFEKTKIQMSKMWQIFKMNTIKTIHLNEYFGNIEYIMIMWLCMTAIMGRAKSTSSSRYPHAFCCHMQLLKIIFKQQQNRILQIIFWKLQIITDESAAI